MIPSVDFQSHRTQLVLTALAASAATVGVVTAYTNYTRQIKRRELDRDLKRSLAISKPGRSSPQHEPDRPLSPPIVMFGGPPPGSRDPDDMGESDEQLFREQLARNYAFFGDEGMDKIRKAKVVVVGCGGVGSWAAVMLVRSGITNIRLVDFDYVTLSSLNRHATATLADVGTPKVTCIQRALNTISRWVRVDSRIDIWREELGGNLLEGADWVIDAIDNITTKVDLLKYCHDNNIKVFSSMGAGAKSDPTRIQISDISYTMYDPLARSVRRRLRLQGVSSGIPVVYSTEVPGDVKLLPLPEEEFQKGDVKELGVFDDFRVRILPVLGPLPAIFGLNIASYIVCDLANKPILNPLAVKGRKKLYERIYRDLLHREEKIAGHAINRLPIDEDDVGFIFEDIHRGRSVLPPHVVPSRPALVRWDFSQPLSLENCVSLEFADAEKHVKECFHGVSIGWEKVGGEAGGATSVYKKTPEELWGSEVGEVVRRRREEIRKEREWVM